jgi:hypothetical protein
MDITKPVSQILCTKCNVKHVYEFKKEHPASYAHCSIGWTTEPAPFASMDLLGSDPPTPKQVKMAKWRARARLSTLVECANDCPLLGEMQVRWQAICEERKSSNC